MNPFRMVGYDLDWPGWCFTGMMQPIMPLRLTMSMIRALAWSLLFLVAVPRAQAQDPITPTLKLEPAVVQVRNLEPGSDVVLFHLDHLARGAYSERRRELLVLHDDDSDGTVELEVPEGVPPRSIWLAVERKSGAWSLAAPAGYPLRRMGLPEVEEGGGAVTLASGRVEVVLVRPGVGVWTGQVADGGEGDLDGVADGRVSVEVARLAGEPEEGVAAPEELRPGDVVAVFDLLGMAVFVLRTELQ